MSVLTTKGVNDLASVADFSKSAAQLGLVDQDGKKLQAFVTAAHGAGALAPGKLDMAAVTTTVSTLQSQGVLPLSLQQPDQVLNMVYATRNLGVNSGNFPEKIAKIQSLGEQFGFFNQGDQNEGKAIDHRKIYFVPYEFKNILSIDLTQAVNEHAKLHISGTLPEAIPQEQDDVQKTEANTPVALYYVENGTVKYLFRGVVVNIKQQMTAGVKHQDIEAVSHSYLLDTQRHSRSFQQHQQPYSYVFARINDLARTYIPDLTGDVTFVQDSEANKQTGRLIVQYQETDWQFLKRIASHFNYGLIVDPAFEPPAIYVGLPPEQTQTDNKAKGDNKEEQQEPLLNVSAYQIRRDTKAYTIATGNNRKNSGKAFTENDFTYCEAHSLDILKLGQKVNFLDIEFYIQAMHTVLEKGALKNTYTLATKQGMMQDDRYNRKLTGLSLQKGIIKTVTKDQVQVHITDIDAEWDEGATWFFPYTTVYSSPDGSGWYCMPEIGDNVRIYFSDEREERAVAVSSVNLTPSKRGQREDPDTKIISTIYGKQVILTPGGIQIIANESLLMTLTDEGGVEIKSDKKIKLNAKDDIEIKSTTSKIVVTGQQEILLEQSGGTVNIVKDIDIKGGKVKLQP